jgi:glycerate-2-kinase
MPVLLPNSPVRPLLKKFIAAALSASDPYHSLLRTVSLRGQTLRVGRRVYNLRRIDRVIAVGAGKASARMALAIEQVLGVRLDGGLVVVKPGHGAPTKRITIVEAGHPIPDRAGLRATAELKRLIRGLTPRDLLLVLLSGGASSLLPAPVSGLTLSDKQRTTRLLLKSGATIHEMNTVRKHLSSLKGGQLAALTEARIVTFILSDVIGDDIGTIGSGPTAPDPTTFAEAIRVLKRRRVWSLVSAAVRRHLLQGRKGAVRETLKPGSRRLQTVQHEIIGNNREMLRAVAHAAQKAGVRTLLLPTALVGEASQAAKRFVRLARPLRGQKKPAWRPRCVVAGGEPTVTVTGRGKGGRAQEFATAAAFHIAGLPNTWLAAVGTDGTDGPTDVAGAIVTGETVRQAGKLGVNLRSALHRHDTYPALKTLQCHIRTGPTGTNVNDLYLLLLL